MLKRHINTASLVLPLLSVILDSTAPSPNQLRGSSQQVCEAAKKLFLSGSAIKEGVEASIKGKQNFFLPFFFFDGEVPTAIKLEGEGTRSFMALSFKKGLFLWLPINVNLK